MRFFPKKKLSAVQMIDKRIRFRQKKISKNFVETENRRLSSKVFYVNLFEK